MAITPNGVLTGQLTRIASSGGDFFAPVVHLNKNNVTPGPGTQLSDMIEADFDGYAEVSGVTWGSPYISGAGVPAIEATIIAEFNCTGDTTPNTIYGYYVCNTPDAVLLSAEKFAAPIPMIQNFQHISVVLRITLPLIDGTALVSN